MAQKTTEFGSFVGKVFHEVFFQPDDELSAKSFKEYFSPDFTANINGTPIPGDFFKDAIATARAKELFKVVQVQEIIASNNADKASGGSVAHHTVFSVIDKETGAEHQEGSLTVVTCALQDGKVVLTQLTEVQRK
ncbi:hypothetical protein TARUN_6363 [Trichoderma arundinaceum]|uniref:Nuclear transport factor 2 family protein n=1 Tax=Trichoderma arundinaceum TaxID=490622 RepID=A0A395NJ40_TRIAR|nr:hypothetical protein TARUN_6363 [Trichoderma arundinaceum]